MQINSRENSNEIQPKLVKTVSVYSAATFLCQNVKCTCADNTAILHFQILYLFFLFWDEQSDIWIYSKA